MTLGRIALAYTPSNPGEAIGRMTARGALVACLAAAWLLACQTRTAVRPEPAPVVATTPAAELGAIPGAKVERLEDRLVVGFSGELLFRSGSSVLEPGARSRLASVADTLSRHPGDVVVKGHTDSNGSEHYNLALSQDRADRVRDFLVAEGVRPSRVAAIGLGEDSPVATNETAQGRRLNRRVEIEIWPRAGEARP